MIQIILNTYKFIFQIHLKNVWTINLNVIKT